MFKLSKGIQIFNCNKKNFAAFYKDERLLNYLQLLNEDKISLEKIQKNVSARERTADFSGIKNLNENLKKKPDKITLKKLEDELRKLPNDTHPRIMAYGSKAKLMSCHCPKDELLSSDADGSHYFKNCIRMDHLGNFAGHKSYYLKGNLAVLEQSIIKCAISLLRLQNFKLVSVPDMLEKNIVEGCGMSTEGERNQIYCTSKSKYLSGTSEMALAGLYANTVISESDLPIKIAAVSRCFRAETSGLQEENGIYRVHQFTKVEMFCFCHPTSSEDILEEFKTIQMDIYKHIRLNFRLIDMPPTELGSSAYQKYDIETWIPQRKMWGEISSCSNCTDYQSDRLNITYDNKSSQNDFVHTVNGTAAAIPRLLIAVESSKKKSLKLLPLQNYCYNNKLKCDENIPNLKFTKSLSK